MQHGLDPKDRGCLLVMWMVRPSSLGGECVCGAEVFGRKRVESTIRLTCPNTRATKHLERSQSKRVSTKTMIPEIACLAGDLR